MVINRKTRWAIAPWHDSDERLAVELSRELSLPPLVARLLLQRGYRDVKAAEAFLNGDASLLHDPYLLDGMKEAVDRISAAGAAGEKIRIYGDYDADGVSSTSLLCRVFQQLNYTYDYYIPHRSLEGYGLNNKAIQQAAEEGVKLLVTVDTGISAYEEVEFAKTCGLDVVVTDHHEPPGQLPNACAVVNPKQKHCSYPFKGLAGVGVAFKLATALMGRPPLELCDIVSLGTIADLMPLLDENRIFVRYGLQRMKEEPSIGFKALAEAAGIELPVLTSTGIAFGMAPRINAAGRLDHAKRAVELLVADDYDSAILAAIGLDALNKERQRIVEETVKEAEAKWADRLEACRASGEEEPSVIMLAGEGWNVGVIGIVASKLLERHYKPVVVLGIDAESGMCKGSARSIEGYDLHAALTECSELLDHYGGHQAAAGMSLHREQLAAFEAKMSALAKSWVTAEQWIPKSQVDLECELEEATLSTISQLALLEPFGIANPSPRLLFRNAEVAEKKAIGKESKHLKLAVGKGNRLLDVIAFGRGEAARQLPYGCRVDMLGELSINEWNGFRKPQLQLHDMHMQEELPESFPSREDFGAVYKRLHAIGRAKLRGLPERLAADAGLSLASVRFMLEVFQELEFLTVTDGVFAMSNSPRKRELSTSARYQSVWESFNGKAAPV